MLVVPMARDSYSGSEPILVAAWQAYQSSKRVSASESPQSQSPVERMATKLGKISQISDCGNATARKADSNS
jgi:putative transposase